MSSNNSRQSGQLAIILEIADNRGIVEKPWLPDGISPKLLALCGIVSPILLIILGGLAAELRPRYNPVTQFGSELGVGSDAAATVVQIAFAVYGLLTVLFAIGLWIGHGQRSWIGPALIGLFGLGSVLSAVFPCVQAVHYQAKEPRLPSRSIGHYSLSERFPWY